MSNGMIFLIIYVIINVLVFALYGIDKGKAKAGAWRISENTLIISALFGAIGAVLGMQIFHHKTRKPKFKIVYVFAIIHIALIAYLIVSGFL